MQERPPTEEEVQEWLHHPVTKSLQALLMRSAESLKTSWAEGNFTTDQHFSSVIKNAEAIGAYRVYDALLDNEALISELSHP